MSIFLTQRTQREKNNAYSRLECWDTKISLYPWDIEKLRRFSSFENPLCPNTLTCKVYLKKSLRPLC